MNIKMLLFLILSINVLCLGNVIKDSTEVNDTTATSNYIILKYCDKLTIEDYNHLLDSLKQYHTTNYLRLRLAYTKTKDYNPYSVDESELFDTIYTKINSLKFEDAAEIIKTILNKDYVNIRAHLISGFIYKKLNDSLESNYHYSVYDGLIRSILESGDGKTTNTAFIVISTKEEYELLKALGFSSNEQMLVANEGHSFDEFKAVKTNTKEKYEFYFNIDIPFRRLSEELKGNKSK